MGHAACMEEMRNIYKIVVRIPDGKRPHGRLTHRQDDSIKSNLKEIRCENADWIHLVWNRI
jgi:hypothetical protein